MENENGSSGLKALYLIARSLGSGMELEESYPRLFTVLAQQMGIKRGGLLMMDAEPPEWKMKGAYGLSPEEVKRRKEYFGSGVVARILEKGQKAAVVDGGESIWVFEGKSKTVPKRTAVSFFCAPVKVDGAIVGILGVDHLFDDPVSPAEDFMLLESICDLIREAMAVRQEIAAENRDLLEENWSFRKELETLGRTVPKARRRISLTEILEDRLARMIAEMKVDTRSNGNLYDEVMTVVEKTLLKSALEKTRHVQLKTARFLGINRNTLRRKMKELGITAKEK